MMLETFPCLLTMLQKKRILIANDSSFLNTGYGIYGKEILTRLHNSGKYDVAELGCYCDINHPKIKNIPWKFYPNAVASNDQRLAQYNSNNLNQFGLWRFNRCVVDFKPHIVFDIRDYWMFAYQEASPYKKYFNWVIMPATDSAPPKTEWLYTFCNADMIMPYTNWAKKTLELSCGNQIKLFPKIANAGINPQEFYPIDNKEEHKKKYFGNNINVIGTVMRNQRRKLLPDLMISYKKYIEVLKQSNNQELADNTYLYLHTSYPEDSGWDIPALLLEYGISDRVYFTYHCYQCHNWFPCKFQQSVTVCKHCGQRSAKFASPSNGITTQQLNEVYNLFDLFVQYAICEGFGMPQIEAAACGLTLASVDYSAMSEIIDNIGGYKIPVIRTFREMETNADRVYPDIDKTVSIMYDYFVKLSEADRYANGMRSREKCISYYTWDNVYKVWEECFDSMNTNSKLAWDHKSTQQTNHSLKVPKELNDKEFIEFICMNVINDPSLMNTSHIQCLIRDITSGMVATPGSISTINRNYLVNKLEGFLNNKIMCENMRSNPNVINKEDFI